MRRRDAAERRSDRAPERRRYTLHDARRDGETAERDERDEKRDGDEGGVSLEPGARDVEVPQAMA
jgi:hypothetical protein